MISVALERENKEAGDIPVGRELSGLFARAGEYEVWFAQITQG